MANFSSIDQFRLNCLFKAFDIDCTTGVVTLAASDIDTNVTNFNNLLSSTDDTIQKALDTLDDMSVFGTAEEINSSLNWDMTPSGGTASQPTVLTYSKGTSRLKISLTWGTTGGEAGNPIQAVYEKSVDSGSHYTTLGTETISYDSDGNVNGISW